MITMAYKFSRTASVYEFDETSGQRKRHYTLENPTPEMLQGMIVVDLWDMKDTITANKKALLEHRQMYQDMEVEEVGSSMIAGAPLDKDVSIHELLGRVTTFSLMLDNPMDPKDMENLDDAKPMIEIGKTIHREMMRQRDDTLPPG